MIQSVAMPNPSRRRATLRDICHRTQLSIATVSRAINDSPLVRPQVRQRVMAVIEELGYVPNHNARALVGQSTKTLGVLFPSIDSGFFAEVLRGIDEVAAANGYHVIATFSHGRDDVQEALRRAAGDGRVDAMILMNLLPDDTTTQVSFDYDMPIVLIGQPVRKPSVCSISIQNSTGAEMAMEHLIRHERQNIAILSGPEWNYDSRERLAGCEHALQKANRKLNPALVWCGMFNEAAGREAVLKHWPELDPAPDAIFACNDSMAIGAMDALRELGFSVPKDVAVIGFDDIPSARHLGLTTVTVAMRPLGRAAAQAVLSMLGGQPVEQAQTSSISLTVRRTCGCVPVGSAQQ